MKLTIWATLFSLVFGLSACKLGSNNSQSATVEATTNQTTNTQTDTAEPTPTPVSNGFMKIMQGKVGDAPIEMNLLKVDNRLSGSYSYNKIGKRLELAAPENKDNIQPDGSFTLIEFGENKQGEYGETGMFKGSLLPDGKMTGTWSSFDGSKKLPFELKERAAKASANLAIKKLAKTEGNCDTDEYCCHIEVVYPVVTFVSEGNAQTMQAINNSIMQILSESMPTETATNPAQVLNEFCKEFKEQESDFRTSWEFELMPQVYLNDQNILSVGFSSYVYMGGAHPNSAETLHNFKLTSGKELELADIFKPGTEAKLTAIAEQKVRALYALSAKEPLTEAGFFEDKFELNNNFALSLKGITFLYNPYEITPYVMGEQRIFIPFAEIKDLLKPDGVVFW